MNRSEEAERPQGSDKPEHCSNETIANERINIERLNSPSPCQFSPVDSFNQCSFGSSDQRSETENPFTKQYDNETSFADNTSVRIINNSLVDANESVGYFNDVKQQVVSEGPTGYVTVANPAERCQLTELTFLQFKGQAEDSQSNKSVMSSRSTRKIFDMLSWLLPIGFMLLIILFTLHFVFYVRDLEPYKSITEIACVALSASLIPLSLVFILRLFCDCNYVFGVDTVEETNFSVPSRAFPSSQSSTANSNSTARFVQVSSVPIASAETTIR